MSENPLTAEELKFGNTDTGTGAGSSYSNSNRLRNKKQKKALAKSNRKTPVAFPDSESLIDGATDGEKLSVYHAQRGARKKPESKDDISRGVRTEVTQGKKRARHPSTDESESSSIDSQPEETLIDLRTPTVDTSHPASISDDASYRLNSMDFDSIFGPPDVATYSNLEFPRVNEPFCDLNNARFTGIWGSPTIAANSRISNVNNTSLAATSLATYSQSPIYSVNGFGLPARDIRWSSATQASHFDLSNYDFYNPVHQAAAAMNLRSPLQSDSVFGVDDFGLSTGSTMTIDSAFLRNAVHDASSTVTPTATRTMSSETLAPQETVPNIIVPQEIPNFMHSVYPIPPQTPHQPQLAAIAPSRLFDPITPPHLYGTQPTVADSPIVQATAGPQLEDPPSSIPPSSIEELYNRMADALLAQPELLKMYLEEIISIGLTHTAVETAEPDAADDSQLQQLADGTWILLSQRYPELSNLRPLLPPRARGSPSRMVNSLVKIQRVSNAPLTTYADPPTTHLPSSPATPSPTTPYSPPAVVAIDSIYFFKTHMNGLYLESVLQGGTDYRGYIIGENTFPDLDESVDEVFFRERRKLLATGKNSFDHRGLKSLKHKIFYVLYQYAIALIQFREKSFARGDVKKFTKERLVDVLNFQTPQGRKATREVLIKHNIFVRGEARSFLSNNSILMTRFHGSGYPGEFSNALFQYIMDRLLFTGTKTVGGLITSRSGDSIPLHIYALIAATIKLNLLAYEKHGHTKDFTLEEWKKEVDEQLKVAKEADDDARFGKTFKETRRRWAYNGVNFKHSKVTEPDVFLGPDYELGYKSDEYSESETDESFEDESEWPEWDWESWRLDESESRTPVGWGDV